MLMLVFEENLKIKKKICDSKLARGSYLTRTRNCFALSNNSVSLCFDFCCVLRSGSLTFPRQLMVENSSSEGARNGAHSLTLPTSPINKAIQTLARARVYFESEIKCKNKFEMTVRLPLTNVLRVHKIIHN